MHNALVCVNNRTPYQALPGRQLHLFPPLTGGYRAGLHVKGQDNLARVREMFVVAIIQATTKQMLARGDERNQVVAMDVSEHQPGGLVDIWYDPPNKDAPGRRGPAQIASVNRGEGDVIVRFHGDIR